MCTRFNLKLPDLKCIDMLFTLHGDKQTSHVDPEQSQIHILLASLYYNKMLSLLEFILFLLNLNSEVSITVK